MDNSKPFYESKTFWATVVTAVAPWVPVIGPIVTLHPDYVISGLGALFLFLRTVTKGAVSVS